MEIDDFLVQYKGSFEFNDRDFDLVKFWVSKYAKTKRAYFVPLMQAQDASNVEHRIQNLLGGVPFTSDEYPWPKTDGAGMPMQSIIQLDLASVSRKLGEDLGDGLLQVWARVDIDREAHFGAKEGALLELRVIPRTALHSGVITDPPNYQPWRQLGCNQSAEDVHVLFPAGPAEMKRGSVVDWESAGDMYAAPACMDFEVGDNSELYELVVDDLLSDSFSPKDSPSIYLGGHGGQAGGYEDPTGTSSLLFRIDDDFCFYIGVTYRRSSQNEIFFNPIFRYFLR